MREKTDKQRKKRFEKVYEQAGLFASILILRDRETGIEYLWCREGESGGLTPLLGCDGKPSRSLGASFEE